MDWMTFSSTIIGQLAWPVTVIILVLLLKKNIEQVFPRLESFKHNNTEFNFAKVMNEVVVEATHVEEEGRLLPGDLKAEEERLLTKIDIAPHAIVHQAYAILDRELLDIYDEHLTKENRTSLTANDSKTILRSLGFGEELITNIWILRKIRQEVMGINSHKNKRLSNQQVKSYLELALDCTAKVREFVS